MIAFEALRNEKYQLGDDFSLHEEEFLLMRKKVDEIIA